MHVLATESLPEYSRLGSCGGIWTGLSQPTPHWSQLGLTGKPDVQCVKGHSEHRDTTNWLLLELRVRREGKRGDRWGSERLGRNDQQDLAPDLTCTHVGGKLPEIDYKQCSATVVTFLNFGESNRIHQQSCWALLHSSSSARHSKGLTERLSSLVRPTDLVHSKLFQTVPLLGRGGQPLVMHW